MDRCASRASSIEFASWSVARKSTLSKLIPASRKSNCETASAMAPPGEHLDALSTSLLPRCGSFGEVRRQPAFMDRRVVVIGSPDLEAKAIR
jgi:hypothetical protein